MRSWKKPTPELVDRAIAALVYAEQYRYFFDRLENPEWLEPLWKRGFFKHPPQIERDEEEGTVRFPPWPEARYLARMAAYKPELVAKIIRQMDDTENTMVLSDLVDALLAMPPKVAAQLAEKAKCWAEFPYPLLSDKLGELISCLAKGGKTEEAMAIARVLLDVLPDPQHQHVAEELNLPPEPRARFDAWHYEQIFKKHYPDLVHQGGLPALELLCDLLEKAIRLSRRRDDDKGPEDYSYIWRPAIEDHPQNLNHTIKDALVSALRDAAEYVVRSGKVTLEDIVKTLENRTWVVFWRIALHILRIFSEQAEEITTERLSDKMLFKNVGLLHEYVLLLRDSFPRLTQLDQEKILGWIEDGPEVDQWKQWRESEIGRQLTEEEVTHYQRIWERDWLARIGPESLPKEWQQKNQELIGEYGDPDHVDFPVYTEVGWSGPKSPKTVDELKAMSVREIAEFLRKWRPPDNSFFAPAQEELSHVLLSVVAEDPGRFAAEAPIFKGLNPIYVRAVVAGLREAVKQDRAFGWKPVLELCEWVVSQSREIQSPHVRRIGADPEWWWTRKAIAELLSASFEDRPHGIPIDLRKRVWDILESLTDDPQPTPEYEERYGGSNMDPATLSINTTRGEAMHAVVRYALWVRRHLEKEPGLEERLQKGFEVIPEVRKVLEVHLDPVREPSLAIRAVYGQWFPWLVLLDPDWASANAVRIFPQDSKSEMLFKAAWITYVGFCKPYNKVLDILRQQYQHAVELIGSHHDGPYWHADPDKKLAGHLMEFYWRGKLSLDDLLLVTFWKNASDDLRAHAIEFVGRSLKQTPGEISPEILDRLKRLWEWRLDVAKKAQHPSDFEKEIAIFGLWFASEKFDVEWAIIQLSESLRLVHKSSPEHIVLEHLARTVQTHPKESVTCLRMIAEGDREGWSLYWRRDHIRRILKMALRHPSSADEAKRVIHYLGSRGFLEFRHLLKM